jgi:hypothetical protein
MNRLMNGKGRGQKTGGKVRRREGTKNKEGKECREGMNGTIPERAKIENGGRNE